MVKSLNAIETFEHRCGKRWYASATEIESLKTEPDRVRKENVRLEERIRIAQELHDTLLQTFISASLHLSSAMCGVAVDSPAKPRLDRALEIMQQAIEEGRSAIQGLRSPVSDALVPALSRTQQELEVQSDIDFRVNVAGSQKRLLPEIEYEIYRIGREALVNAFCHSLAERVELELEYADHELRMRIRDNGCGIDSQALEKARGGHWGLLGMRERAEQIGARLRVLSKVALGTEVELCVPGRIAFEQR